MSYNGNLPEIIRFGRGVRFLLENFLLPGKALFICGRHSVKRIRDEWENPGVDFEIVTVSGELPLDELENILSFARRFDCRNFIGWGGGSAMDCAKAVAALVEAPGTAADYFYNRAQLPGRDNRMILIPTTAGTGAEITSNSVICDHLTGIKQSLRGAGMTADAALCDPDLLENTPSSVIAAAGFDALTQALESFTSLKATELTRQISLSAAKCIFSTLENAFDGEPSALDELARGSMLTGIAFASSGLGAVHGLAHPLGSILNIPHGTCCAILLLPVLRLNCREFPELFTQLARGLGFANYDAMFDKISYLQNKFSIASNFRSYGLGACHYDFVVKNCRSGSMKCNPKLFTDEEIITFLEELS